MQNDWRLTNQKDFLFRVKLLYTHYKPYRADWCHDHCSFCQINIQEDSEKAYCTKDYYHWICKTCYADFAEMFEWEKS